MDPYIESADAGDISAYYLAEDYYEYNDMNDEGERRS